MKQVETITFNFLILFSFACVHIQSACIIINYDDIQIQSACIMIV